MKIFESLSLWGQISSQLKVSQMYWIDHKYINTKYIDCRWEKKKAQTTMQVHDEHSGTERLAWAMVSRKCITGRHVQHPTCLHSRKAHAEQLATGGSSSASKDLPRQVCKGAQHSRIPGKSRGPERLSHSGGIHPAAPCNAEMGMNPKFPSYPSGCSFDTDRSSCMSPVIYRVLAGQETCHSLRVFSFNFHLLWKDKMNSSSAWRSCLHRCAARIPLQCSV